MKVLCLLWMVLISFPGYSQTIEQLAKQVSDLYEKGDIKKAIPLAEKGKQQAARTYGTDHTDYAYFLNTLGILYAADGQYKKAEGLYIEAANIYKAKVGAGHPNYIGALDNLASVYSNLEEYDKAETLFLQVKEMKKRKPGPNDPSYANTLNDLGLLYHKKGEIKKAEQSYLEALAIWENGRNEQGRDYATNLGNLGALYMESGFYFKAEPILLKANKVYKKVVGTNHPVYANNLNSLGVLYSKMAQFKKAEQYHLEASSIFKDYYTENSIDYALSVGNLARVYSETGQFKKSEEYSIKEITLTKNVLGDDNSEYAQALNTLGQLYDANGQPDKALPLFLKARDIFLRKKDPGYAYAINNLAALYTNLGQYEKAEKLYLDASEINLKVFGTNEHILYANTLNNLAHFYAELNQLDKAIETMKKANDLKRKLLGEGHPDYAISLDNLASIYIQKNDYKNAAPLSLQAAQIREKTLGTDHPLYARSLHNLAMVYKNSGDYRKAEELLLRYSAIVKASYGEKSADYSTSLNDLGVFYIDIGNLEKAETLLTKSVEIGQATYGDKHPEFAIQMDNMAKLYFFKADFQKAANYSMKSNQIIMDNARRTFASLSDKEKTVFLEGGYDKFQFANNILYNSKNPDPQFKQSIFNHLLMLKSLSLTDTRNMLNSIRRGRDESLKRTLEKWEENKQELSRQYSLEAGKRISNLKQLESETEELEKKLNRESVDFRESQTALQVSIQDIQKQLGDDEVAIDFVNFRIFKKSWTESIMYGAYVLKKNSPTPIFVPLCNENDLTAILGNKNSSNSQDLVTKLYRGGKESAASPTATASLMGENLYKLIWQPLEVHLNGVRKINYVPAGKLFSIAFHALPAGKGQLLIDKYELKQFTSSRELSIANKGSEKPRTIVLFGDAKFSMDSTELRKASSSTSTSASAMRITSRGRDQQWDALPGTGKEVDDIEKLFRQNGISSLKYTNQSASESNLKKLSGKSPEILHLATHGFFLPTQSATNNSVSTDNHYTSETDPLLRNGILLAGANYTWSGKAPLMGAEDGVVTAYEISQLDLTNTKLVVLSACETALGDVQGTEGVFGLQRSFKMAGVDKLILSLWQVPDKETAELMKIFYSNWLGGKSIREAFTMAQTEMRNKYPPYFWAAFVLID